MAEVYRVDQGCQKQPLNTNPPSKIDMPVHTVNNAQTPVHKIVARQGSSTSWERETTSSAQRYADVYFNSTQFTMLKDYVNTSTPIYVSYNAPAISGHDQVFPVSVSFTFP